MQFSKLPILVLFLMIKLSASADIALPKTKPQAQTFPDTKYYFANVDSFPQYKFFVKNLANKKTYKIKQSQSFVLKSDLSTENHLDVWATNKTTNQQTNVFSLALNTKEKPQEYNTIYIAITFLFDKNGKLSYKQTVMKPDCYSSKKQSVPFFAFNKPTINLNNLLFIPVFSLLVLFSISVIARMKQRNAYV